MPCELARVFFAWCCNSKIAKKGTAAVHVAMNNAVIQVQVYHFNLALGNVNGFETKAVRSLHVILSAYREGRTAPTTRFLTQSLLAQFTHIMNQHANSPTTHKFQIYAACSITSLLVVKMLRACWLTAAGWMKNQVINYLGILILIKFH